jgi:hypothetical protein
MPGKQLVGKVARVTGFIESRIVIQAGTAVKFPASHLQPSNRHLPS